jgi:DNA-directed RNA polymerase specialized sigma24 family protein
MDNAIVTPSKTGQGIPRLLDRALLTAHLLTGSLQQAEKAALDAVDSWDPGEEPEEVLFQNVLDAAAQAQVQPNPSNPDSSGSHLPDELKAVLRLAPQLRRCFVLRILAGLPAQACARLLCLHSDMVETYTCDALQCLARGA